jgi:CheY-specific phosphatase CheX
MKKIRYKLEDNAVRLILEKSVRHAFEGNFQCPLKIVRSVDKETLSEHQSNRLQSPFVRIMGDFEGTLCLQMPVELVKDISRDSLGLEIYSEEMFGGENILRDAAGEIVNMVAGTFKNMLSRAKLHCRLSPPENFRDERQLVQYLMASSNQWILNLVYLEHVSQVILWQR